MWFQIFGATRGTRPTEALPDVGGQKMAQWTAPLSFLFGLFRGAPFKSETTFVYQHSILFHKYGLKFLGCASEHYAQNPATPPSDFRQKTRKPADRFPGSEPEKRPANLRETANSVRISQRNPRGGPVRPEGEASLRQNPKILKKKTKP